MQVDNTTNGAALSVEPPPPPSCSAQPGPRPPPPRSNRRWCVCKCMVWCVHNSLASLSLASPTSQGRNWASLISPLTSIKLQAGPGFALLPNGGQACLAWLLPRPTLL